MENFSEDVLIPIFAIFSAIALPIAVCGYLIILVIKTRTRERMELIKQGIVPNSRPKAIPHRYISLRNSFICIGVSLGIIIGITLQYILDLDIPTSILTITASILFCLGIAYMAFFFSTKNKNLDE